MFAGEKFTIETAYFQDPMFTRNDQEFLEQRGHSVMPYSESPTGPTFFDFPCDPLMLELLSSTTMFYAPGLMFPVALEVVARARPCLYLGSGIPYIFGAMKKLCLVSHALATQKIGEYMLTGSKDHSEKGPYPSMKDMQDFVYSRDLSKVPIPWGIFYFMWTANTNNKEARLKLGPFWEGRSRGD